MKPTICILISFLLLTACRNKETHPSQQKQELFTCSMHPEVIADKPGNCPKCGMILIKKEEVSAANTEIHLESLLKPTNEFVISQIPVTTLNSSTEQIEIKALGNISYDTRETGSISARVSGRIERLYVRYRYQRISKGQKLFDIYSPELLTAQQNLLFLIKNDPSNISFIESAKEKLLLLGMSKEQLGLVVKSGNPSLTISVFSNYNGHIHEAGAGSRMVADDNKMKDISLITEELPLKEGMYVQKGQAVFTVFDPDKAWAILNIYGENQSLVKEGNPVEIIPETSPDKAFEGQIDFIEPFYRKDSKTLTVRVFFNNSKLKIPIGSQVKASVYGNSKDAAWLPDKAVLSLGLDKVVFVKSSEGFRARKVTTGILFNNKIQILDGVSDKDSIAVNAQFLMDSESFIKIND